MNEHEVEFPGDQGIFQPCESLKFWLMIDGQLVHLAHRRHPVPFHVALTSFAKCVLLLAINLDLDFDIRYVPDTVLYDVPVWGELVVSFLELIVL